MTVPRDTTPQQELQTRRASKAPADELTTKEQAHRRLEQLYELSNLFASFETVEQTFDPALGIAARTLPLRSAILIEEEVDRSKMSIWAAEGQSAQQMRAARQYAEAAFSYLLGAAPSDLNLSEHHGKTSLPSHDGPEAGGGNRFIVIPLVVANRRPFGVLQIEGAQPLDKSDLMFVNSIANQLAVALDRSRAWRQDIALREVAEERRSTAERRSARAENDRVMADSSRNEAQALAEEHAGLYHEAQKAIAVREQILAIVSHDLRSPLATILLATTMLSEPAETQEVVQTAGKIQRAAERMLRLIEDLLDFANIEAGRLAVKRLPEEAGSMLEETVSTFESIATKKGLQLTAEIAPALPMVSCDRDRILQVFSNLVGNATKIVAKGGQIKLGVEPLGDELLFTVVDNGPGIKEADVKHLFERYWRSDTASYKGTGLGLAIARGIVKAHAGKIWVESEVGRGSKFFFTVPLAAPAAPPTDKIRQPH